MMDYSGWLEDLMREAERREKEERKAFIAQMVAEERAEEIMKNEIRRKK